MNNQKILIVDDEKAVQFFLKMALEKIEIQPYDVYFAENGQEALELLPTLTPDLIMIDAIMPIMSGDAFVEHIKDTSFKDIPIIFYHTAPSEKYSHIDSNNIEKIAYPFSPDKFRNAIVQLLGTSQ